MSRRNPRRSRMSPAVPCAGDVDKGRLANPSRRKGRRFAPLGGVEFDELPRCEFVGEPTPLDR